MSEDSKKIDAILSMLCACFWCGAKTENTAKFVFISPDYFRVEKNLPVCQNHDHDLSNAFRGAAQTGWRGQFELIRRIT